MTKRLPASFHCPTEFTLAVLGGKWKTVILCYLKQRPCRYSELRKLLPRVSDKVLTERLRDLVASGLIVHRKGGRRADTYALAPRGRSLHQILHHLYIWGHDNAAKFHVAVGEPLRAMDAVARRPER
ncbi:MAG TPA: helix-turn-helix domain-containing protein [Xanthobacteraceae bacterium]|jgi:DNA-binding HxlR family transcriptional regulator|nr:helix-turn-helix domain-containing protein [Xanthobacteraceae bacterium]